AEQVLERATTERVRAEEQAAAAAAGLRQRRHHRTVVHVHGRPRQVAAAAAAVSTAASGRTCRSRRRRRPRRRRRRRVDGGGGDRGVLLLLDEAHQLGVQLLRLVQQELVVVAHGAVEAGRVEVDEGRRRSRRSGLAGGLCRWVVVIVAGGRRRRSGCFCCGRGQVPLLELGVPVVLDVVVRPAGELGRDHRPPVHIHGDARRSIINIL
ncbi:Os01g0722425, partial [Oryza sativa Japonica Group]